MYRCYAGKGYGSHLCVDLCYAGKGSESHLTIDIMLVNVLDLNSSMHRRSPGRAVFLYCVM